MLTGVYLESRDTVEYARIKAEVGPAAAWLFLYRQNVKAKRYEQEQEEHARWVAEHDDCGIR